MQLTNLSNRHDARKMTPAERKKLFESPFLPVSDSAIPGYLDRDRLTISNVVSKSDKATGNNKTQIVVSDAQGDTMTITREQYGKGSLFALPAIHLSVDYHNNQDGTEIKSPIVPEDSKEIARVLEQAVQPKGTDYEAVGWVVADLRMHQFS